MLYHAIYLPPGAAPPPRESVHSPELARYVQDWGRVEDIGYLANEEEPQCSVGAAWLRLMTKEEPGYGYVDDATPELSIAVLPLHRGRGLGTLLLKYLLDEADVRFKAVSLSVSVDNPAVRIYERAGFKVVSKAGMSLTMNRLSTSRC